MWSLSSSSPRSDSAPGTLKRFDEQAAEVRGREPPRRNSTSQAARMRLRWAMTMSVQRAMGELLGGGGGGGNRA